MLNYKQHKDILRMLFQEHSFNVMRTYKSNINKVIKTLPKHFFRNALPFYITYLYDFLKTFGKVVRTFEGNEYE